MIPVNSHRDTMFIASLAGVQRGGRGEVKFERRTRSLGSGGRSQIPTLSSFALEFPPSFPFVRRPRRLPFSGSPARLMHCLGAGANEKYSLTHFNNRHLRIIPLIHISFFHCPFRLSGVICFNYVPLPLRELLVRKSL